MLTSSPGGPEGHAQVSHVLDLETRISKQKNLLGDLWQMFAYNFTFWFCPIEKKKIPFKYSYILPCSLKYSQAFPFKTAMLLTTCAVKNPG